MAAILGRFEGASRQHTDAGDGPAERSAMTCFAQRVLARVDRSRSADPAATASGPPPPGVTPLSARQATGASVLLLECAFLHILENGTTDQRSAGSPASHGAAVIHALGQAILQEVSHGGLVTPAGNPPR
ncbi:hypothetical protein ACFY12_15180 [Streptomyces sp. NPDC001339]|uniref:hypothetical protein n=1 Tax=Streptomyces sp. NPDC001339 TaxID=3364563 RepID=UPI0036908333